MQRAVEITYIFDTTVYDASFAALAESLNAVFVTADEKLTSKLEKLSCVRFLGDIGSE